MKYGIFGQKNSINGEPYLNRPYVHDCLNLLPEKTQLISGGGRGVETWVQTIAEELEVPYLKITPNLESRDMRSAFATRNMEILMACDKAVVFWDGNMTATWELLRQAMIMKKSVILLPML